MFKLKEAVFTACAGVVVSTALMSTPVQAADSYVARMNDEGKYCARVKVQTVGFTTATRTKCRTLEQWEEMGYVVDNVRVADTVKETEQKG